MNRFRSPSPATIALLVCAALVAHRIWLSLPDSASSAVTPEGRWEFVQYVLDGDTVETQSGERIRLLGIDAPEVAHHDQLAEPYGPEATEWLRQRLQGKRVLIVTEARQRDVYGRTLAWIYDDRERLINEQLLETGNARLLTDFGLPARLESRLRSAEARAAVARIGLWK